MKYFDTYYAGIKHTNAEHNASGLPLAFITPEGDDKAAEKRKKTVDEWTFGYYWGDFDIEEERKKSPNETMTVDNKPMRGFKIVDWGGRNITDNKVVRVVDPRGYELEIYIPNLLTLIQECKINKGEIDAELVWLRDGANNRLYRTDSKEYIEALKNKKNPKGKPAHIRHAAGDIVVPSQGGTEYIYLGMMTTQFIGLTGEHVLDQARYDEEMRWRRRWNGYDNDKGPFMTLDPKSVSVSDTTRSHVYYHPDTQEYTFYTKQMTISEIVGKADDVEMEKLYKQESKPVNVGNLYTVYYFGHTGDFIKNAYDKYGYNTNAHGYWQTAVARWTQEKEFTDMPDFDVVLPHWNGHSLERVYEPIQRRYQERPSLTKVDNPGDFVKEFMENFFGDDK